jgi:hypothetical protein
LLICVSACLFSIAEIRKEAQAKIPEVRIQNQMPWPGVLSRGPVGMQAFALLSLYSNKALQESTAGTWRGPFGRDMLSSSLSGLRVSIVRPEEKGEQGTRLVL